MIYLCYYNKAVCMCADNAVAFPATGTVISKNCRAGSPLSPDSIREYECLKNKKGGYICLNLL